MPLFKYEACDAQGKEQTGQIEAVNRSVALIKLRERGLFPSSFKEMTGGTRQPSKPAVPEWYQEERIRQTPEEVVRGTTRSTEFGPIRESRERPPEQTTVSKEQNMALVKCKDCGKDISRSASKCPNCGADMKTASNFFIGLVFLGGALVLSLLFGGLLSSPTGCGDLLDDGCGNAVRGFMGTWVSSGPNAAVASMDSRTTESMETVVRDITLKSFDGKVSFKGESTCTVIATGEEYPTRTYSVATVANMGGTFIPVEIEIAVCKDTKKVLRVIPNL